MSIPDLIERFADVPLEVSAAIHLRPLRVSEILGLQPGGVLASSVPASAPVELIAGGARIGAGKQISAGARISVRLTEIGASR